MPIKVTRLSDDRIPEIACLHMDNLPTPFSGNSGKALLGLNYQVISKSNGGTGFVALDGNTLAGYVCGVWNPALIKRELLRRYGVKLLLWGGIQALTNPKIIKNFITRFKNPAVEEIEDGYELRPIVVKPEYRGKGVSGELVRALMKDASDRGYSTIHLLAEVDNIQAVRFYEKVGFIQDRVLLHSGKRMVFFSMRITGAK